MSFGAGMLACGEKSILCGRREYLFGRRVHPPLREDPYDQKRTADDAESESY